MYFILLLITFQYFSLVTTNVTPLKIGRNYVIYERSHYTSQNRRQVNNRTEETFGSGKDKRTVVIYPSDVVLPEDEGGPWGDLVLFDAEKDGILIARETIVNPYYPAEIAIYYNQTFEGFYLKDFQLLNFGRERGYAFYTYVHHHEAYVESEIIVPPRVQVRILAEAYGETLEKIP